MPIAFLIAASIILIGIAVHYTILRGWKWAGIFTACAIFFGLWHEANPLREQDPEYWFSDNAITVMGLPIVGVIGWIEVIYLSWFLVEILFPKVMRSKILVWPAFLSAMIASLFSLCIETTGIAIGWWIWREDRQHIIYPMAGWATQVFLFSCIFFALFHATYRTKIMLAVIMVAVFPTFLPSFERHWMAAVIQAVCVFSFLIFARFDPKSWAGRDAAKRFGVYRPNEQT